MKSKAPKLEPVKEGSSWSLGSNGSRVRIFKTRNHKRGYDFFEVRWRVGKRVLRRYRTDFSQAVSEAQDVYSSLEAGKQEVSEIPSSNLLYLSECQKRLGDTPMHVAVEFYLQHFKAVTARRVDEAIKEFIDLQRERGCSDRYVGTLENRLEPFGTHFSPRNTHEILKDEIYSYLKDKQWSPKTQSNFLGTFMSFARYCCEKHYLSKQALGELQSIPVAKEKTKTPEVFTPAEMANLLALCNPRDLAYVAITAFAGGRRAEIQRLRWKDVDLEEKVIRMDSEITKTNSRRILEISDVLLQWLKVAGVGKNEDLVVRLEDPLMDIRTKFRERNLVWKHNALRHSFISYDLAANQNAARTAELSGTSVGMIKKHYKSLVSKKAAETYFGLTPDKIRELCIAQSVELAY